MGGGASTAKPASGGTYGTSEEVDPISKLSQQYIISNGVIRLRNDADKLNNPHNNNNANNEVQVIQAADFSPNKKRVDSETKESMAIGHDVPIVEDIDDAGSIVGGMPS